MKKSVSLVFNSELPVELDVEELESIPSLGPTYELKELSDEKTYNNPTPSLSIVDVDLLVNDPEVFSEDRE